MQKSRQIKRNTQEIHSHIQYITQLTVSGISQGRFSVDVCVCYVKIGKSIKFT